MEIRETSYIAGMITVAIPAYNAEQFLEAAVQSALNQTWKNLEVIVVDDGSTDSTFDIAKRMAALDDRVRVIQAENGGVGEARNRALHEARGEYFAPLDADDLWEPEKLSKQVSAMEAGGQETGMAYCLSNAVDVQGNFLNRCPWWRVEGDVGEALLYRNFIGCASVPLFRTALLKAQGGYLTRKEQGGVQGCEDWDAALRVAAVSKTALVADFLVGYRQIPASMSTNYAGMARSYEIFLKRAREILPSTSEDVFRWSASNFYVYMLMKAYAEGHYAQVLSWLPRIVAADPLLLWVPMIYRVGVVSIAVVWFGVPWKPRKGRKRKERNRKSRAPWERKKGHWVLADSVENYRWSRVYPTGFPDERPS